MSKNEDKGDEAQASPSHLELIQPSSPARPVSTRRSMLRKALLGSAGVASLVAPTLAAASSPMLFNTPNPLTSDTQGAQGLEATSDGPKPTAVAFNTLTYSGTDFQALPGGPTANYTGDGGFML